jgi:signal transduction histidine kinase/ligand-binding sensor domain-containing protein
MLFSGLPSTRLQTRLIARRVAACLSGLLALCLGAQPARAQYRFDHWTADNGLPQNSVRDIVQTRDGYLWLTTFDGLVRFDGVRFTVFNKSNTPGLSSNRFISLFEDRSGDLWASVETGQLVRRHQERFIIHIQQDWPIDAVPFLSDDGQGNVALRFPQSKVEGNKVTEYIWRAYRYREGLFQPADELTYSLSQLQALGRAAGLGKEAASLSLPILVEGDLWATTTNSVTRFLKGGGLQVYSEGKGLPGKHLGVSLGKPPLQVVSRDAAGRLWVTELKSGQSQLLSQQTPEGFVVWCTYADNEGNYWIATNNNGLFRARRQTVTPYARAQGLDSLEIYPILESRDGSLWVGTKDLFRLKDGAFTRYNSEVLYPWSASSLYEDRAGQLWVSGGWRLEGHRLVRAAWAKTVPDPFILNNWTMCEDREGGYWIGSGSGVVRHLNGFNTYYTTKDGLAGNDTKVIIEDGQGGLWLGSYGGLTHYKDGKFTAWTEKDGLPSATVRALKQDSDGTLWIGTYDSGLGRFKDGKFTRYTTKDGLFDNGVFQILEDDYGWFWMSCNRGIYRVRKQELLDFAAGRLKTITSLAYNKSDGMPSSEGNGGRWPAGVKTRDGKLWFPTMGGVAMIDPANVKANTQPPPVVLEELRINNQPAPFNAWDSAIRNPQSAIRIEPGQDNFEIAYTALSFINSENMRFKYKLEGADTDWVEAGTRRTAYFSHLAPGNYTFRVIAANADGVWNQTGASMRITIVPPFWRTWWFTTLSVLCFAGLVAGAVLYRDAQQKRRQAAQQAFARQLIESQEHERKRIAAELHDSLGQNLLIVKNRAQLGQIAAHDAPEFLEQFEWIGFSATQSIEEVREIAQNLRPYHLDRLGLTKALEVMIEKVAATTKMRFVSELVPLDDLFSKEDAITLYRVVQESLNNIVKHAQASEVRVSVERTTDSVTLTIQDNGRGFAPSDAAAKPSGFGLAGMAERVWMLGGEWRIDSHEGQGTTVTIRLALQNTTKGKHNGR